MLFQLDPPGFQAMFEVVGCAITVQNKLLMLKRPLGKRQGGKWGLPGGKMDPGETSIEAMVRELREETSLNISQDALSFHCRWAVTHPEHSFRYTLFSLTLPTEPIVTINPGEHEKFEWVEKNRLGEYSCVDDLRECVASLSASKLEK